MGERDDARHQVEQTRARMSAVAHEVSRRMTPEYAKERATEMARYRAIQARDRAVDNPWLVPLLGAGIGALVGRALAARAQDAREREWEYRGGRRWSYGEPRSFVSRGDEFGYEAYGEAWRDEVPPATGEYGSTGGQEPGIGERASEMASEVKERVAGTASDVKERVVERAGEYRDRMREGAQHLRERIPDAGTIRERAQEQPGMWVVGAMALGALFGFAVPMSDRERRVLEPAREKARETGQQALDKAMSRAESAVGEGERRTGEEPRQTTSATSPSIGANPDPFHEPLH
jgi:ElaB/YqjD/DUF883 family membrane-anchored ribosome-binding protein